MWIESRLQVGDRPIGLQIERLDDERREQTAVVLAWLALQTLAHDRSDAPLSWHQYAADILRDHVSFVINDEPHPERLEPSWWAEALGRALAEFVRHNDLAPSINRHLKAMRETTARQTHGVLSRVWQSASPAVTPMASMLSAQRLWLLERPPASRATAADQMDFAAAVAVLEPAAVYVLIIISDDERRASERGLFDRGERLRLERDAFKFETLDEALDATSRIRERFIARGWRDGEREVPSNT
jgi:hypothetical protein